MPNLIDVKTLAERLAVSERTVYDLVKDGVIPYIKVGRLLRFDPEKVLMHLTVSPEPLLEINMPKKKNFYEPSRGGPTAHQQYEHYKRGARNPFKNYDDYGNLIAKDGDE